MFNNKLRTQTYELFKDVNDLLSISHRKITSVSKELDALTIAHKETKYDVNALSAKLKDIDFSSFAHEAKLNKLITLMDSRLTSAEEEIERLNWTILNPPKYRKGQIINYLEVPSSIVNVYIGKNSDKDNCYEWLADVLRQDGFTGTRVPEDVLDYYTKSEPNKTGKTSRKK